MVSLELRKLTAMNIRPTIIDVKDEFTKYRRTLHQTPQTAFEESYISDFVANKLKEWGIPFERNIGKTGIVVTIKGKKNDSGKSIGIRADMDALDIFEEDNKDWKSTIEGKMHGCGHDGHTTSLLGTAKHLKENNDFNGTVYLIFQPAEENGQGAKAMIDDGLLERFPCNSIYAMHNWPYIPLGHFEINEAESMAAVDYFEITIEGKGGHASKPHTTIDSIIIASQIINSLQTIISRETDPFSPAVLSVTNINGGTGAFNVIPSKTNFGGTVRSYDKNLRKHIEKRIKEISSEIAGAHGAIATCIYENRTQPTINHKEHAQICTRIAKEMVGDAMVIDNANPSMGGEDFGIFLEHIPGAYIKIGQAIVNEPDHRCSKGLHNAGYDFNDDLLPITMEYWTRLVEHLLPIESKKS